jgi:hypothetical protein
MSEQQPKTPRVIPWAAVTACLSLLAGTGLSVAGIYVLAGLGWALLAGAAPCLALAFVIIRGLRG